MNRVKAIPSRQVFCDPESGNVVARTGAEVTDPPAEPTAEPEAFGLLAPQRGLTATEHQARHAHMNEPSRRAALVS